MMFTVTLKQSLPTTFQQSRTSKRRKAIKTQTLMYAMQNILIISQHVQPAPLCLQATRHAICICHATPRHAVQSQCMQYGAQQSSAEPCLSKKHAHRPPQKPQPPTPTPPRPNPQNTKKKKKKKKQQQQPRTVYPQTLHKTSKFKLKVYIEKCPTTTERVFAKSDIPLLPPSRHIHTTQHLLVLHR